jgi:hypothetical protein
VTVTIEIDDRLPNGASDQLVRTVTENSRTRKFDSPRLRDGVMSVRVIAKRLHFGVGSG